jgi:hypothetical protein
LIGGVLLGVGSAFLYKWNKNKRKRKNAIPTPGNNEEGIRYNHNDLVIPREIYNQRQEKIPSNLSQINRQIPENANRSNHEPINNNVYYNHGQAMVPIANDGRSSVQNINDILEKFKDEMLQTFRQEILQNSGQQNIGQASNTRK